MKQNIPGCYAGDCPSLDGGPVSISHEGRMAATGRPTPSGSVERSEATNVSNTAENGMKQKNHEKNEATAG